MSVHFGHLTTHKLWMPLAADQRPDEKRKRARVLRTEEKGSDGDLATHMLHDAHMKRFDIAVVVSNDSDLLSPIRMVREELGKPVGVLDPHKTPIRALQPHVDFYTPIREGVLNVSQFPDTLADSHWTFTKPAVWRLPATPPVGATE